MAPPDANPATSVLVGDGIAWDYALAGIPFLSAVDAQNPAVRETAQYRKEQFDSSAEPGEQSIVGWWLKSQSSWHGGAGQAYIDTPVPGGDEIRPVRYDSSVGIDPWTQGRISLLSQVVPVVSTGGGAKMVTAAWGTNNYIFIADGANLRRVIESPGDPPTYSASILSYGGTGTILAIATDGPTMWVATSAGIWRGHVTALTYEKLYSMPPGTGAVALGYAKQRMMAGVQTSASSNVYALQSAPTGPLPVQLTAGIPGDFPAPVMVHAFAEWTWTAFAEAPGAILGAGYAGNRSAVYKFVLDSTGEIPELSTGIVVAELPIGELVYDMQSYINSIITVVTSRGLRVGQFTSDGTDFSYGPLTLVASQTGGQVAAYNRFLYATYTHSDGVGGLARIDTSQQLSLRQFSYVPDQKFAWAPDLRAADGSENPVTGSASQVDVLLDGRLAFIVDGVGLYVQHPSKLVPQGTLRTSRIRFNTLDPKVFRFLRLWTEAQRTDGDSGSVSVSVGASGAGQALGSVQLPNGEDSGDLRISLPPARETVVTLTLARSAEHDTVGPIVRAFQLKALPAQRRQRMIQVPVMVYDRTGDHSGQMVGYDGQALEKIRAVEAIEQSGDMVVFEYLSPQLEQILRENVVIERLSFRQVERPNHREGWGGVLILTLRTVD